MSAHSFRSGFSLYYKKNLPENQEQADAGAGKISAPEKTEDSAFSGALILRFISVEEGRCFALWSAIR